MAKKISLVYISNRSGGLDILRGNLQRQTIQDFEVIFVDGLYHKRKNAVASFFKDFDLYHLPEPEMKPEEGYVHLLSRCWNTAFKHCTGEVIIALQDYIYVPYDGFEKFIYVYERNKTALISGVGHQYSEPGINNVMRENCDISIFSMNYYAKPKNKCWTDPRVRGTDLRVGIPIEWEANWALIPREVIYKLGGMDEEYDKHGFGYDNTNIAERAAYLGHPILIDQANEVFCIHHENIFENHFKKNGIYADKYHFDVIRRIKSGEVSPILNYLS